MKTLAGLKAKQYFNRNLDKLDKRKSEGSSKGYFKEGDKWIAFDDKTNELWTEEFDNKKDAIRYLN